MKKFPSLCEYLAELGGIRLIERTGRVHEAGDLKAMGADKWHMAAPFRKRLVQAEKGLNIDAATQSAWLAGYFPHESERPEINVLLDAIADELQGRLCYTLEGFAYYEQKALAEMNKADAAASEIVQAPAPVAGRVIPPGSEVIHGAGGDAAYLYEVRYVAKKSGREGIQFLAKVFAGEDRKPTWHHTFKTHEERIAAVESFLAREMVPA